MPEAVRQGSAIPTSGRSTRHHEGPNDEVVPDKAVDHQGTGSGRQLGCPHPASLPARTLWERHEHRWTVISHLTRGNRGLSTIHRSYYPNYLFHTNNTVLTTTGLLVASRHLRDSRIVRSVRRPIDQNQKNRECQR